MEPLTIWNVSELFHKPESSYAVVILNEALFNEDVFHIKKLWQTAALRLCVDGGTNSFYNLLYSPQRPVIKKSLILQPIEENGPPIHLPDIISGDFDSVDSIILQHFREMGVQIIETPDQNATDFTKALLLLGEHITKFKIKINHVIVIAGINSNRFDHAMAHLHTLYKIKEAYQFPVIIMSGKSLIWLLSPGSHLIKVPPCDLQCKKNAWCGYSSLSESTIVTTKGLKWDIEKEEVAFGKMISTSNTYDPNSNGKVTITCSKPLLWFMGWVP